MTRCVMFTKEVIMQSSRERNVRGWWYDRGNVDQWLGAWLSDHGNGEGEVELGRKMVQFH